MPPTVPNPAPDPGDAGVARRTSAQQCLDAKTKPPGSLGRLEVLAVRLAVLQDTLEPSVRRQRLCVYAASHGVAAEGVSVYPAEVTAQMVRNFLAGGAAINVLARHGGIGLHVVDVGVAGEEWPEEPGPPRFFVRRAAPAGTRNFLREPAMSPPECARAVEAGREQVRLARRDGIELLGIGEMGIGNTTAASALCAGLLGLPAGAVVGRGTGLDDAGLRRKESVVARAVALHGPAAEREGAAAGGWLRHVGGLEIAAMAGTILEAATGTPRLPVVVDGFIATAAAAAAFACLPAAREVCFFSHCSAEDPHRRVLATLGEEPLLDLGLRLGEGTGAALAMPLLAAAAKLMAEMATFASARVTDPREAGAARPAPVPTPAPAPAPAGPGARSAESVSSAPAAVPA